MRYFDSKTSNFYKQQNAKSTRIPFDDKKMNELYSQAKLGVIIDIGNMELPSFIDREYLQITLLNAAKDALTAQGGHTEDIATIDMLLAKYAPTEEEGAAE